jgi:hypothetical protein
MARTLGDGHLSPLDGKWQKGNIVQQVADLRRQVATPASVGGAVAMTLSALLSLITGTPTGSTFLRDDGSWAAPTVAGSRASDSVSLTGGLQSTGSTSWADLPGASITLTTSGGNVLLTAAFILYHGTLDGIMGVTFSIDGTDVAASGGYGLWSANNPQGYETTVSPVHLVKSLAAGSHTFKVRWKTNTGTVYAVQSANSPFAFAAVEQ